MSKRSLKWLGLLALAAIAALIALGVALWRDAANEESRRAELANRAGVTEDMDDALALEKYELLAAEAMRHVSFAGEMTAENGRVGLMLENGAENACDITLELIRVDTGETLLSTGLIKPGYYVDYAKADSLPDAGEHACVARLRFFDNKLPLGEAGRHVLLLVLDERRDSP